MDAHQQETLRLAALVAGLGPRAEAVVTESEAALAPSIRARTCIDAGASVLLSVTSRAGRPLRLHLRLPTDDSSAAHWLDWCPSTGDRSARSLYAGTSTNAYEEAVQTTTHCGRRQSFLTDHARIGPYARLYAINRRCASGHAQRATISWHLDRHLPTASIMDRAGLGHAWAAAAPVLDELFGYSVSNGSGPWSVSRGYGCPHDTGDAVRIGTSRWTRLPDDDAKRHRGAGLLAQLGGERAYVEALFHLLDQRRPPGGEDVPIGRAVELDVLDGEPVGAELFFCPATPRAQRSLS
jgi:hypothetical protein